MNNLIRDFINSDDQRNGVFIIVPLLLLNARPCLPPLSLKVLERPRSFYLFAVALLVVWILAAKRREARPA